MKKIALLLFLFLSAPLISSVFAQKKPNLNSIKPICNGLATYLPQPEVPQSVINANGKNIFGTVNVQILIDEKGNVEKAQAVTGHPLMRPLAEKAVSEAKFRVTTYSGKPVKVNCVIVYNFKQRKEAELILTAEFPKNIILSVPKPEYPKAARLVNASGEVFVEVIVDKKGKVESAKAVSGHILLHQASEKAALQAKFKPSFLSGNPVRVRTYLIYNFISDKTVETEIIKDKKNLGQTEEKTQKEIDSIINLGRLNDKALILQMPKYPTADARVSGNVDVKVKIDLQKGEVVPAEAISGHPLLRIEAEKAALQSKFPPILTEFSNVFGQGFLVYKSEDFNGKVVENKTPKKFLIIEKGIINNRAKSLPKPTFPSGVINALGSVKVIILIDMNGEVILAKAVSGHPLLKPFAESAARKAEFSPSLINTTEPIYVKASLLYKFNSDHTVETAFSEKDLVLGSPLILPKPLFPSFSGIIGSRKPQVFVQIEIDENGDVTSAKGILGHPVLRAVCETAARNSKFSQTKFKGVPVKAKAILLYEFNLDDDSKKVELKSIEMIKPE